ncbi:hypothetical protein Tco_0097853, partial [Tanacetum coccineum]
VVRYKEDSTSLLIMRISLEEEITRNNDLEESLNMFMAEIAIRHDEHSNLIKEIQASTDFALRNQKTLIEALEIQPSIRRINGSQYAVSNLQNRNLFSESKKTTLPSPNHLNDDYLDELKETDGEKDLEAHYTNAKPLGKALPQKEKDPGRLGDLIPTKLIVELANRTVKRPKGIAENMLVEARLMGKALRKNRSHDPKLEDYIELSDLNEPLELRHDQVVDLGPNIEEGEVIDTRIKEMVNTRHDDDKITNEIEDYPSFNDIDRKIHVNDAYNLRFFSMIGYEHVDANFFPFLCINMMSKRFYNSIMKDKLEFKGKSVVGAFISAPTFVGTFSVVIDFAVIKDMDRYRDEMGDVIVGKEF